MSNTAVSAMPFEEDDDFEDFEVEGISILTLFIEFVDWDQSQEDQEDTALWLDNWDSEDIQDEFLHQLRYIKLCLFFVIQRAELLKVMEPETPEMQTWIPQKSC